MLAAMYRQGEGFSIGPVPKPSISGAEVLLKVRAAAICGTDVKIIRNGHRKLNSDQRIILGHEFVGVVAEVGDGVSGFRIGQRVSVTPNAGCGNCRACLQGESNYCSDYTAFGIDMDGGHAEYVRVPEVFLRQGNVVDIPESITDVEACLLEPLSCVVNGIRASQLRLGDIVVVFGVGPMGLLHVMLALIAGASKVIAVDTLKERLDVARLLGAGSILNDSPESVKQEIMDETGGVGADVIITACSVAAVQERALELMAPFGRLCLFGGLPRGSGPIRFDSNMVHYRNYLVTGSTGGGPIDYRIGMSLVKNQRVDLQRVVSDEFALSELAQAYDKACNGAAGKVVLIAAEGAR